MTTTNEEILKEVKEMSKTQVDMGKDVVGIKKDIEHTRITVDKIDKNDVKQNGTLAEVVKDAAVLQGQFKLAKWAIGIVGGVTILAALGELSGYVQ